MTRSFSIGCFWCNGEARTSICAGWRGSHPWRTPLSSTAIPRRANSRCYRDWSACRRRCFTKRLSSAWREPTNCQTGAIHPAACRPWRVARKKPPGAAYSSAQGAQNHKSRRKASALLNHGLRRPWSAAPPEGGSPKNCLDPEIDIIKRLHVVSIGI